VDVVVYHTQDVAKFHETASRDDPKTGLAESQWAAFGYGCEPAGPGLRRWARWPASGWRTRLVTANWNTVHRAALNPFNW